MGPRTDLTPGGSVGEHARHSSTSATRLDIIRVVCGLLAGVGVTLGVLAAVGGGGHHGGAPRPVAVAPVVVDSVPTGAPSPVALDQQWSAYSNQGTCADWVGGDGVSAVRLSRSQIAWFFSDSYLGPAGPGIGFSHLSGFVHNLVVMQTTTGRKATFVTLTGGGACAGPRAPGEAASVVSPRGIQPDRHQRYWAADGVRVGRHVLKLYNRYLPGPPPFTPVGTAIASFGVDQLARAGRGPAYGGVARPRITVLPAYTPPGGGTPIIWGAALLRVRGTVYVYGWQSHDLRGNAKQAYLARVAAARLAHFSAWRFYAGGGAWAAGQQSARPIESAGSALNVSTGFSVVPVAGRYWLVEQAVQAGNPDIEAIAAPAPSGPFDPASRILVYRSPDIGLDPAHDYRIMYEARVEPALSDRRTLVISYNVNSVGVTAGCVPLSAFTNTITQPRFIAVPRAVFSPALPVSAQRYSVSAGPSPYPPIISKNPSQWFNAWAYPHGCPPVPPVADLAAHQSAGAVWLEWPSAGIGLRYRVYLRTLGSGRYILVRTLRTPGTRLTGLVPGRTYQVHIVGVNAKHQTGHGPVTTVKVR